MIDLYYWPTPNGWKVSIMLEECGLPYRLVPIDITTGQQFDPAFLRHGPNNRIPAIVDHDPVGRSEPFSIFESGAILTYLAEKSGKFLPQDRFERSVVTQWLMWQVGGLGPTGGQNGHFLIYAPEKIPYAIKRYGDEKNRLYGVLDGQLKRTGAFVAGNDCSIADFAIFPWIRIHARQKVDIEAFPHVLRWYRQMCERPALRRGIDLGKELRAPPGSPVTEAFRRSLYGQTAASVHAGGHQAPGDRND